MIAGEGHSHLVLQETPGFVRFSFASKSAAEGYQAVESTRQVSRRKQEACPHHARLRLSVPSIETREQPSGDTTAGQTSTALREGHMVPAIGPSCSTASGTDRPFVAAAAVAAGIWGSPDLPRRTSGYTRGD